MLTNEVPHNSAPRSVQQKEEKDDPEIREAIRLSLEEETRKRSERSNGELAVDADLQRALKESMKQKEGQEKTLAQHFSNHKSSKPSKSSDTATTKNLNIKSSSQVLMR